MSREYTDAELFGFMFADGSALDRVSPPNPNWRGVYDASGTDLVHAIRGVDPRAPLALHLWALGTGFVCDYSYTYAPIAYSTIRDRVSYWYAGHAGQSEDETDCPACGGTGRVDHDPCPDCDGIGAIGTPALTVLAYQETDLNGRSPRCRWIARRWRRAVDAWERDH